MKRTLLLSALMLFGCEQKEDRTKLSETEALPTPKVIQMVEKFNRQANRLELNGCEFLYNGKLFLLGMSVRELNGVLGKYDYFNRGYYVWEELGVVLVDRIKERENPEDRMSTLKLYLHSALDPRDQEDLRHELAIKKDIFLFNGIPLNNESSIQDLIDRSIYEYADFSISDRGYSILEACGDSGRKIRYFFSVEGGWIYGGGGHLRYKTDVNKENENLIKYVGVEYE